MLVNDIEETKARAVEAGIDVAEDELFEVGVGQFILYAEGGRWSARFDDRPVMDLNVNTEDNPIGFGDNPEQAIETLIRRRK